jgi:hypothetical protein
MRQDDGARLEGFATLEMLEVRLAVRDVGWRVARGVSREEIRADYPDLRDHDIELAHALETAPDASGESFENAEGIERPRFRRLRRERDHLKISEFDRWVSENNIPDTFEYSKRWWDYVELVRRFASRCGSDDIRIIGHYFIDTPPPCERLPMPTVAISLSGVTFALRFDFGAWSEPTRTSGAYARRRARLTLHFGRPTPQRRAGHTISAATTFIV